MSYWKTEQQRPQHWSEEAVRPPPASRGCYCSRKKGSCFLFGATMFGFVTRNYQSYCYNYNCLLLLVVSRVLHKWRSQFLKRKERYIFHCTRILKLVPSKFLWLDEFFNNIVSLWLLILVEVMYERSLTTTYSSVPNNHTANPCSFFSKYSYMLLFQKCLSSCAGKIISHF